MPKSSNIAALWQRVDEWLRENGDSERQLPTGASAEEIEEAENVLGTVLPKDVRESYRVHNGSNGIWLFPQGYLMPLTKSSHLPKRQQARIRAVTDESRAMKEIAERGGFDDPSFKSTPKGPIRRDWWNPKWIRITNNECGDCACIDLVPQKDGKRGQIIDWDHDIGATRVLADSFREWLATLVAELDQGACKFEGREIKRK